MATFVCVEFCSTDMQGLRVDSTISTALAKERLFEAYQGEKELYLTDGDHHSARTLACRLDSVGYLDFRPP